MLPTEEVAQCRYVPFSTMKKAYDVMVITQTPFNASCKQSLLKLQTNKHILQCDDRKKKWRTLHHMALCKAIYTHNWNKLLYMLKKSPIWEYTTENFAIDYYMRALTILLMYHPYSKANGMFKDYMHMVLSCRTEEDKKAVFKIMLTMQEKIFGKTSNYNKMLREERMEKEI